MEKYIRWINEHVAEEYGQCAAVTSRMLEAFPELVRVRGHYFCPLWGERSHWWLKTTQGVIVDPTVGQFPSKGRGAYVEWIEGCEEPSGMCPNCGGEVFGGGTCCSDACGLAYAAYCLNP